jgi:multisubunit Na+/H+ antiporter MnhC subunit
MIALSIAVAVAVTAAAGLYLALSRDLMRIVIGLLLIGSSANLFVFGVGGLDQALAPLVQPGLLAPEGPVADPLPQALVLTAIVIGFALACFAVALVLALHRRNSTTDSMTFSHAEPPPRPDGEPGDLA